MGTCSVCGGPVPARERGRPAVYCSRSCQAKAYRARKAGRPGGAMSDRQAARLAAFHAGLAIDSALANGWQTLDRYGADRPRVEAALAELRAELDRRARGAGRAQPRQDRTPEPARDETPAAVTEPAATPPAETTAETAAAPEAAPARPGRDETLAVTETEREREEREWQERADRERAEFERRLKPVPEFGDGYQMAEWPGTGRYHLVYRGERIGHAAKKPFGSMWEAFTAHGPKIPATGTYKTRRDALVQVALHHRERTAKGQAGNRR